MSKLNDLTGMRFGRLIVISRAENVGNHTRWKCRCDCGNITYSAPHQLKSGRTQSCGCKNKEDLISAITKHGQGHTRLYKIWCGMKKRCSNSNYEHFDRYGGRGIVLCDEWNDFKNFYRWAMSNGYKDNLTIERENVDGNYCPENCSWIPKAQQTENRSNTVRIVYHGITITLKRLSDLTGMNYKLLHAHYRKGDLQAYAVGVTYLDRLKEGASDGKD